MGSGCDWTTPRCKPPKPARRWNGIREDRGRSGYAPAGGGRAYTHADPYGFTGLRVKSGGRRGEAGVPLQLGIDVRGTLTDTVALDQASRAGYLSKVPT